MRRKVRPKAAIPFRLPKVRKNATRCCIPPLSSWGYSDSVPLKPAFSKYRRMCSGFIF